MNEYEIERKDKKELEKKLKIKDDFTLSDLSLNAIPWYLIDDDDMKEKLAGKTITIPLSFYLDKLLFLEDLRHNLIYYNTKLRCFGEIDIDGLERLIDCILEQEYTLENKENWANE